MEEEKIIRTKEDADLAFWNKPYFAFLDIMGFRELVKNNPHDELVSLYKRLVNFQVEFYEKYHQEEQKHRAEKLGEYFEPTGLRLVSISDSIMLWTKNSKENSLIELASAVKLLMSISMSIGIPLRGAIVKGDIEILERENSLSIIGRGLVHAYETEGKQNWSGCTVDNGIFTYLKSIQNIVLNRPGAHRFEKLDSLFVETEIPFKDKPRKGFVINWADNTEYTEEQIRDSFSKYNKRLNEAENVTESIELKIENTLKFYKEFGGKK
jgi:hypothetical protein